jgi:TP901 family phage tail tape measure protein
MSDLRLGVDADTRQAEAKIAKLADRPLKLNLKNSISQPLGRITGQVSEFNKSLEASNARVLAFGASAGSIFVVQKALNATLKSAIEVEKALLDINVVLGVSSKSLATFGSALFDIAKNTGQSFEVVANAATELARQGLSVQQTLQRTSDALILTRLSGLDTVKSVEALTAAVNTFSKAGVTSTQIINKFANVDAGFAVSSADLAEAISRVGSTAQDVGVDLDQLIALVTAAQQTTARGGSVIGNSFKTIFTRLQRSDTLDALEEVGIKVRDLEGEALPAIQILNNLAGSFQNLSKSQQAATAEAVGGVFQINVLRSTLGDLGKEYSIYDGALRTSASSTNEAIKRNEALNASLSSLVNKTFVNLNQAAAEIGKIVFAPAATETLDAFNSILEAFNQPKETEGIGTKVAKGILGGLGNYLSGPGLAVIGTVFIKLFGGLTAFSANALKTLLNISSETDKIAQAQSRVNELLAQNPQLIQAVMSKEMSLLQVEEQILNVIRQQNAARVTASTITTSVAKRVPAPRKYGGFIPNFADAEIMGARSEGYNAQRSFEVNNPVLGRVTVNNREKTNSVGVGGYPPGSFIVNPNQLGQVAGVPLESIERMRHKGFIPNFAKPKVSRGKTGDIMTSSNKVSMIYPRKAKITSAVGFGEAMGKRVGVRFPIAGFNPKLAIKPQDSDLEQTLGANLIKFTNDFIGKIFQNPDVAVPKISKVEQLSNAGSFKSIVGTVFETAVDYATEHTNADRSQNASIDFMRPNDKLKQLFQGAPGQYEAKNNALGPNLDKTAQKIIDNGLLPYDVKEKLGKAYIEKSSAFRDAQLAQAGLKKKKGVTKKAFRGFIPNFAALEEAVQREQSAGIASSMIRIGANEGLRNNNNPMGLGVYNTRDEPSGLGQGISRRRSKGFVPNFATRAFDEDYRAKVRGAGGNSLDRFSKSIDKASAALNKMAQSSNQATTANQNVEKAASRTSGFMQGAADKALALSIALPIVTGIISQFGDQTSKTAKFIDRTSTLLTDTATGVTLFTSLLGKNGAALGALSGGALGVYQIFDQINKQNKENFLNPLKTNAESASETLQQLNGNIQDIATPLNQVIQDQKDGAEISAEALNTLAEKINNLPLNIQEQVRPSLESGNFEGILKTLQTASSKAERESKSKSLAAGIGQKMVNAKKGENGGFIDIYGDAKAAASDAQDVINNVFSGLNKTEITELNKRLQESGGNFLKINQILQQAAKDTDADASALKELNLAFKTGATNGKELAKQMLKQAAAIEKNANAIKKTKVPVLGQKQDLTGAGNILGGKESFLNPQERYASISEFASGASKYVEGNRRGDMDTKGRGAYEMMSTLVKSGNINPETFLKTNAQGNYASPLAASAADARKQQIMQGGARLEEMYKSTLKPGEKADPELMKTFKDLQTEGKAQELANQSIKEFLMTDAQKTYAAFAPTLQEMLGALELLKAGPDNENLIQQLSVLSQNILGPGGKAEEQRAKMGQSKEDFYGYDFKKTGEISPGSTYGRMVAQATKGKYNTPEAKAINEQLKSLSYPSTTNPESRLTEIPANGSAGRGPGMSDAKDLDTAQNAMRSTTELMAQTFNDLSTEGKAATIALVGLATAAAALTTVMGVKESIGGGKGGGGGPVDTVVKTGLETVTKKLTEKGIQKALPLLGNLAKAVPGLLGTDIATMGAAGLGGTAVAGAATAYASYKGGEAIGEYFDPGAEKRTSMLEAIPGMKSIFNTFGGGQSEEEKARIDKELNDKLAIENKKSEEIKRKKAEAAADAALTPEERGQKQAEKIAGTTASVNISPINANVNITATPDATTIARIAGLEAVMQNLNEQVRSIKAQNGENVPPSIFSQSAQPVALM